MVWAKAQERGCTDWLGEGEGWVLGSRETHREALGRHRLGGTSHESTDLGKCTELSVCMRVHFLTERNVRLLFCKLAA